MQLGRCYTYAFDGRGRCQIRDCGNIGVSVASLAYDRARPKLMIESSRIATLLRGAMRRRPGQ